MALDKAVVFLSLIAVKSEFSLHGNRFSPSLFIYFANVQCTLLAGHLVNIHPRAPLFREDKRRLQAQLSKSGPAVDFICELVHATRNCIKELVRSGDLAHFITALAAALKPVVHDPQPDNREVWCPFNPDRTHWQISLEEKRSWPISESLAGYTRQPCLVYVYMLHKRNSSMSEYCEL